MTLTGGWWDDKNVLKLMDSSGDVFAVHPSCVIRRGLPVLVKFADWEKLVVEHARMSATPFLKNLRMNNVTILKQKRSDNEHDVLWGITLKVYGRWTDDKVDASIATTSRSARIAATLSPPCPYVQSNGASNLKSARYFGQNFFLSLHFLAAAGIAEETAILGGTGIVPFHDVHLVHDNWPTRVTVKEVCAEWCDVHRMDWLPLPKDAIFCMSTMSASGPMPLRNEGHPKRPLELQKSSARSPRWHSGVEPKRYKRSTNIEYVFDPFKEALERRERSFDVELLPSDVFNEIFGKFAARLIQSTTKADAETLLTLRLVSRGLRDAIDMECHAYLDRTCVAVKQAYATKRIADISDARTLLLSGRLHLRLIARNRRAKLRGVCALALARCGL